MTSTPKPGTIALAVRFENGSPSLVEYFSDQREVDLFEFSVEKGEKDPLKRIYDHRIEQTVQDEKFSDYVEELLSQPFVKAEIVEHGVKWFQSRRRIEQFQREETHAAKVIADYAFKIFCQAPERRDFILAASSSSESKAQVRIRVFVLEAPSSALIA